MAPTGQDVIDIVIEVKDYASDKIKKVAAAIKRASTEAAAAARRAARTTGNAWQQGMDKMRRGTHRAMKPFHVILKKIGKTIIWLSRTGLSVFVRALKKVAMTLAFVFGIRAAAATAVVIKMGKAVLRATQTYREFLIVLKGSTGSIRLARDLADYVREVAIRMPVSVDQLQKAVQSASVIPALKTKFLSGNFEEVKENVKGLAEAMTILSALNPQQGPENALFAIREALAGQFRSLRTRFDISPQVIAGAIGKTQADIKKDSSLLLPAIQEFGRKNIGKESIAELSKLPRVIFENIRAGIDEAWRKVGEEGFYDSFVGVIQKFEQRVINFIRSDRFSKIAEVMSDSLEAAWDNVLVFGETLIDEFIGIFAPEKLGGDRIEGFFTGFAKFIEGASKKFQGFVNALRATLPLVVAVAKAIAGVLGTAFATLAGDTKGMVDNWALMEGAAVGFVRALTFVSAGIANLVEGFRWLYWWAKSAGAALSIANPMTTFNPKAKWEAALDLGIAQGNLRSIESRMGDKARAVMAEGDEQVAALRARIGQIRDDYRKRTKDLNERNASRAAIRTQRQAAQREREDPIRDMISTLNKQADAVSSIVDIGSLSGLAVGKLSGAMDSLTVFDKTMTTIAERGEQFAQGLAEARAKAQMTGRFMTNFDALQQASADFRGLSGEEKLKARRALFAGSIEAKFKNKRNIARFQSGLLTRAGRGGALDITGVTREGEQAGPAAFAVSQAYFKRALDQFEFERRGTLHQQDLALGRAEKPEDKIRILEERLALYQGLAEATRVISDNEAEMLAIEEARAQSGIQEKIKETLDQISEARLDKTREDRDKTREDRDEINEKMKNWTKLLKNEAQATVDIWLDAVDQIQSSIEQGLGDSLFDGLKTGFKNLADIAQNVGESIIRMLIQIGIKQAAIKLGFTTASQGAAGAAGGEGGIPGVGGSLIGTFLSAIGLAKAANGAVWRGGFQAFANGSPNVSSPTLGLIGEGPMNEAVVPLPDGRRIPVDMRGQESQRPYTIVNIIDPGEMVKQGMRANPDIVLNEIAGNITNGGRVNAAIEERRGPK
jgi:uncharacterized coiled-coil DUF342 family protein